MKRNRGANKTNSKAAAVPLTNIALRKKKRKEDRLSKRKSASISSNNNDNNNGIIEKTDVTATVETAKKQQPKQAKKQANSTKKVNNNNTNNNTNKKYEHYDKATASQFEKDDEEIALLEQKLNISSSKQKQKLHKEYAKLEGYGDDFGDFLDSLDHMGDDIDGDDDDGKYGDDDDDDDDDDDNDDDDYDDEEYDKEENMNHKDNDENFKNEDDNNDEIISMKPPATTSSSTIEDEDEYGDEDDNKNSSSDEEDDNEEDDEEEEEEDPDFDEVHTYTPVVGEDLYGNKVDLNLNQDTKNAKYIPPHLRNKNIPNNSSKKEEQQLNLNKVIDPNRQHDLITIQRLLTNNLNRLSDETLESVTKSISSLHSSYPSQDVNDMYWSNIKSVCVTSYSVMTSLIPTYTACAAGVDYLVGGAGVHHFGCYLVEHIVLNLWDTLNEQRNVQKQQQHDTTTTTTTTTTTIDDTTDIPANNNKEGSNLMLILCYLYNYNVIPCTIIYDIIRDMILHFTEIDIEILLLILTHCGYQLRCDDPVALKDIVLLVQERALRINNNNNNDDDDDDDDNNSTCCSSSRVRYMVSAITDLKNNKRTKTNISLGEKSSYYRKAIGRIKSTAKSEGKSTDSALHTITLQDILNIKTKGRWWKVGASWSGSQFHDDNKRGSSSSSSSRSNTNRDVGDDVMDVVNNANDDIGQLDDEQQELLVVLASQNRMNSDIRRKIFCIVMGSDDISHAFEKLIRANLLKGRMERDVMRVIVDCCSQENAYNPYYAHLICRICEYQPRCKFTLQLTFWDYFKQFETMNERKVANLAKLLSHLLRAGPINLNVLKVIEMDLDEDMHNSILLFLTILFTHLFDNYNNSEEVSNLFRKGVLKECHHQSLDDGKTSSDNCDDDNDNNDNDKGEEGEILRGNLSLFLIQYIKFSPKNVTKSNFHKNYKAATKACDMDGFD